jgi:DNA modification methylase
MINLMHGDCLTELKKLDDNSVDSIVTDPPYGLSFMGKVWDKTVPSKEVWEEAIRVLKPGGHLLAFAGTRTQHRMAVNIEDAGFEIRDMIAWVYGSGFPKSHNISKSIDKVMGATPIITGTVKTKSGGFAHVNQTNQEQGFRPTAYNGHSEDDDTANVMHTTTAGSPEAAKWEGWGTALKPALEPITVARKPLEEKTVAANVLKYGTGGINIDASRVPLNDDYKSKANGRPSQTGLDDNYVPETANQPDTVGRFPANFIHDGSDEVTSLFPHSKSGKMTVAQQANGGWKGGDIYGTAERGGTTDFQASEGSAARFFYCAKSSKKDRSGGVTNDNPNIHPTVKPIELMKYLIRMVTPTGGVVLDPFMGSGSTGRAANLEGFGFVGIELDETYFKIASDRINKIDDNPLNPDLFE